MTDDGSSGPERRLDLGALDAGSDGERTDAVVAAVMSRIAAGARVQGDDVIRLLRARRRMLAVAAVLAMTATAAVVGTPNRARVDPAADLIAGWTQAEHVPTNGELLATFQEYRP